jgi:hypothetical protein
MGVPLRVILLALLLALANVWAHFHLGVEVSTLLFIDVSLGILLAIAKLLEKAHSEQLNKLGQKVLYFFLKPPVLAILWVVFLGVTLFSSAIVVEGERADRACIHYCDSKDCDAMSASGKEARFLKWTAPFGVCYTATLDDSDPLTIRHFPWHPSVVDLTKLSYAPSVLVRVPYPHSSLVGGAVQIRNPQTKSVLTTVPTTVDSASLLLGRTIVLPLTTAKWDAELESIPQTVRQKVRERWRARLLDPLKIARDDQLEAVFRTAAQLETNEWDDVFARQAFTVEPGGAAPQDVAMVRR